MPPKHILNAPTALMKELIMGQAIHMTMTTLMDFLLRTVFRTACPGSLFISLQNGGLSVKLPNVWPIGTDCERSNHMAGLMKLTDGAYS